MGLDGATSIGPSAMSLHLKIVGGCFCPGSRICTCSRDALNESTFFGHMGKWCNLNCTLTRAPAMSCDTSHISTGFLL